ncbi:hypothetical protein SAMN06264364_13741, partial [Quadrisphaera granulorum]
WSVAVNRTGPPGPPGPDGRPTPPAPAAGDGVIWTAPTGHTYRVDPQVLLDPVDTPPGTFSGAFSGAAAGARADAGPQGSWADPAGGSGGVSAAERLVGGLPLWAHRLLADVLPAWVGWPPDGTPAAADPSQGRVQWSPEWARAVFTDVPPDPLPDPDDHLGDPADLHDDRGGFEGPGDDGEEPCLFDDLPTA